jgi:hypothetical protein
MSDFDFLLTHTPVGRAAKNILNKGFSEEFVNPSLNAYHSDLPLPIKSKEKMEKTKARSGGFEDHTGKKIGRMEVMGRLKDCDRWKGKGKGSQWLVRCFCGKYEVRRIKAINKILQLNSKEEEILRGWMCRECIELEKIKAGKYQIDFVQNHQVD